jgi:hypothetical protein
LLVTTAIIAQHPLRPSHGSRWPNKWHMAKQVVIWLPVAKQVARGETSCHMAPGGHPDIDR